MKSYQDMVAEANAVIDSISAADALHLVGDATIAFIDLRDAPELEKDGKIPDAIHASRGMLEFFVDPSSPYHNPVFASGKRLVFYCASGGRSALAAQTVRAMGLADVSHIAGGLRAWKEACGPIEQVRRAD
jgi:rhodanese-related sulfurtransferase